MTGIMTLVRAIPCPIRRRYKPKHRRMDVNSADHEFIDELMKANDDRKRDERDRALFSYGLLYDARVPAFKTPNPLYTV